MAEPVEVLLGLGSNLGEPEVQLTEAVRLLTELVRVEATSSIYRTAPVGFADQPDFLNLVCAGTTDLPLEELLRGVQGIERRLGRDRPFRDAPRLIDIDLLAYGEHVVTSPTVTVPHPRMHHRAFVLVPLAEVRPDWIHPELGSSASALLAKLGGTQRVERLRPFR